MILSLRTLDFWPYFYTHRNSYLILPKIGISAYFYKHWNSDLFLANIGILILSFQTMEFWPYFYKLWNCDVIRPNIGILALFIHTGILTSSFETMVFWPYSYKHLPVILFFHCNNWNSCPILPNINLNSASIFTHIGILTSSFQTLQFSPHLYTH